jgi:hypothetical protein
MSHDSHYNITAGTCCYSTANARHATPQASSQCTCSKSHPCDQGLDITCLQLSNAAIRDASHSVSKSKTHHRCVESLYTFGPPTLKTDQDANQLTQLSRLFTSSDPPTSLLGHKVWVGYRTRGFGHDNRPTHQSRCSWKSASVVVSFPQAIFL